MSSKYSHRELRIAPASGVDWPAIEAIGRHSIQLPPRWTRDEETLKRVVTCGPHDEGFGTTHVLVARSVSTRLLAGYIEYQLRRDGDVHVAELAAIPPVEADRVPLAGTMLLRAALERAREAGFRSRVTLNVIHLDAIDDDVDGELPAVVGFYVRFGFRIQRGDPGYLPTVGHRAPGDLWMTSTVDDVLGAIGSYLALGGGLGE